MNMKNRTPKYAVRLVVSLVLAGTVFFVGLRFFVPDGSKLTGTFDAASLNYIASAPVAYRSSNSCGSTDCHSVVYQKWSEGAHGARQEQSKCEACHGPQGDHPEKTKQLVKVRGDGDVVELCLSCHRKLKARGTTGQPQISPQEHPHPHEGVLLCTQCHDPHVPGFGAPASADASNSTKSDTATETAQGGAAEEASIASSCFTCHGPMGRGGFAPELAGQSYDVLKDKLLKYRSGEISSPMMNPIVSGMKDNEIDALAQYFAERS